LYDYLRMSESSVVEVTYMLYKAVLAVFGETYLRAQNAADTARLMGQGKARGFPEILVSIGCMHWNLKNCPFAWQGCIDQEIMEHAV